MVRPAKNIPVTTDESKRLLIVFEDCKKAGTVRNATEFAKLIGTDQGNYSKMVNGKKPLNYMVIKNVCYKLGYNPAWFINGEGRRKTEKEEVKMVTEIQMLRTEIDILSNRIKRVEARTGIGNDKK